MNQQNIFFGEDYLVARKQAKEWFPLNANNMVNSIGILLEPHGSYQFKAKLYPLFNDNKPGIYKVIKEIGFNNSSQKWFMSAEFRIE